MELHDGVLQTLGYLYLKTDQAEGLASAAGSPELAHELALHRDILEDASQSVRQFIADLQEAPPPPASLREALGFMIDDLARSPGVFQWPDIILEGDGAQLILEANRVAHLVRIAREGLINAAQHGHARRVRVLCRRADGHGEMRIDDNGCGFDVGTLPADGRPHFGLSVMAARAARIGAELTVRSVPHTGTSVLVRWPL
jgi:signal transduction histidine kinase